MYQLCVCVWWGLGWKCWVFLHLLPLQRGQVEVVKVHICALHVRPTKLKLTLVFTPSRTGSDIYQITRVPVLYTYINITMAPARHACIVCVFSPKFVSQTKRRSRGYFWGEIENTHFWPDSVLDQSHTLASSRPITTGKYSHCMMKQGRCQGCHTEGEGCDWKVQCDFVLSKTESFICVR